MFNIGYIEKIRDKVGNYPLILNSAGAIINNSDEQILFEYRKDTENWGIPGGYMEPGESFEETINRELMEELAVEVVHLKIYDVFSGKEYYHEYPNGDKVYSIIALFEAKISGDFQVDNNEISRVKFFDHNDLPKNMTRVTEKVLEAYF
ncbi:NUDIX domain-containing protein [Aquibacillus halophilus]|uniref:NUDIX domain-containing protein n=1 Tax=Aquibacillus halophilus TaxID=930132 RepID=A0A6A8D7F3_9BACI|nr:NUDIX domain-containing protein [Aquibacillus halophilus]